MSRASSLLPSYNLPSNTEKITTVAPQTFRTTTYTPSLHPHLVVKDTTKAHPLQVLQAVAAETISTYPDTITHVYTDGSAMNAVEQAGYGLTTKYPDAPRIDISEPRGQHCNNYDTELEAIRSALQTISNERDGHNPPVFNNIVIFTNSQSTMQAIAQCQHYTQPIVTDIMEAAVKLYNRSQIQTSIKRIPGHFDIPGNDTADMLAKKGASKTQPDEAVSYSTAKQIVLAKSQKVQLYRWARETTGRTLYQHQKALNQTYPIEHSSRLYSGYGPNTRH